MNGAHAELFTFVLHLELNSESQRKRLVPLQLASYQSVTMADAEPHVALAMGSVTFIIISSNDQFRIAVVRTGLAAIPEAEKTLTDDLGFSQSDTILKRCVARGEARDFLFKMASKLAEINRT